MTRALTRDLIVQDNLQYDLKHMAAYDIPLAARASVASAYHIISYHII